MTGLVRKELEKSFHMECRHNAANVDVIRKQASSNQLQRDYNSLQLLCYTTKLNTLSRIPAHVKVTLLFTAATDAKRSLSMLSYPFRQAA